MEGKFSKTAKTCKPAFPGSTDWVQAVSPILVVQLSHLLHYFLSLTMMYRDFNYPHFFPTSSPGGRLRFESPMPSNPFQHPVLVRYSSVSFLMSFQ